MSPTSTGSPIGTGSATSSCPASWNKNTAPASMIARPQASASSSNVRVFTRLEANGAGLRSARSRLVGTPAASAKRLRNVVPGDVVPDGAATILRSVFPRRLAVLAAAGALLLAACGGGSNEEPAAAPAPSEAPAPSPTAASPTAPSESTPAASPAPADDPADDSTTPVASADGAAPTNPTAPTDPTVASVAVPAALDFSATTVDGSEIELGQFAGRPVLLWFWAPW